MSRTDEFQWIDPRPKYPNSGAIVTVKRADGTEQKMICEHTWGGWCWKSFPGLIGDSIAHAEIVGWHY